MPNIPPQGAYALLGVRAAPVDEARATLTATNVVREVVEIWASDPAGVKKLVWVARPETPATATATYVAATPASAGHVHVAWTPLVPLRSDSYAISRPNGILAGHAAQGASSFDDPAPVPLNGQYRLTAQLETLSDVTPALASLNLSIGPTSFAVSITGGGGGGDLTWGHPTWGRPHQYQVWRDGAPYVTLDGAVLSYQDANPTRGATHAYQVFAVLSGVVGGGSSVVNVAFTPLDPANVAISSPFADDLRVTFSYPGGAIARYEVQRYDANAPGWVDVNLNNVSGLQDWTTTTNVGYLRVRAVGGNGLPGNYVQVGPLASIVPPVALLSFDRRPGTSTQNRAIANIEAAGVVVCGEYLMDNPSFPGWRTSFITGAACQTNDGASPPFWDADRFQSSPMYFHIARVRNGVYSAWTQYGPV